MRAGDESVAGELLITKYGLEGGAIYQLGRALRDDGATRNRHRSEARVHAWSNSSRKIRHAARTASSRPGRPRLASQPSRRRAASAATRPSRSAVELAALAKTYPLALRGPRPIEEAISTAGGVSWDELDDDAHAQAHARDFLRGRDDRLGRADRRLSAPGLLLRPATRRERTAESHMTEFLRHERNASCIRIPSNHCFQSC